MLYLSLAADLEDSPVGDDGWLDRAAEVCGAATPSAADEVRSSLAALLDDHELSHAEVRRLKALAAGVPADAEPLAGVAPDDEAARCAGVVAVLRAVNHHRDLIAQT